MTTSSDPAIAWDSSATTYYDSVISPFDQDVDFRLSRDLEQLLRDHRGEDGVCDLVVTDFGCGCGEALALVAEHARWTVGIDFSEKMLSESEHRLRSQGITVTRYSREQGCESLARDVARAKRKRSPRTILLNADFRDLRPLRQFCDIGLAINSISPPRTQQVDPIVRELTRVHKPGGFLLAVFPSWDTVEYLLELATIHNARLEGISRKISEAGIFADPTGFRQKFFHKSEIETLCAVHGWKIETIEKVRYPWSMMQRYGWGYFPNHEEVWDWYVMARKRDS